MTRRLLQAALLGAACLLFLSIATPAVAARSALAFEPAIGPPTAIIKATGSGFAGREVVALYFDGLRPAPT
jgi:hypothetical protein